MSAKKTTTKTAPAAPAAAETFTQADLADALVARDWVGSRKVATALVTAIGEIVGDQLAAGKVVKTPFGTYSTRRSAARTGRDPRTGADIQIPARTKVAIKPTKALRDAVA